MFDVSMRSNKSWMYVHWRRKRRVLRLPGTTTKSHRQTAAKSHSATGGADTSPDPSADTSPDAGPDPSADTGPDPCTITGRHRPHAASDEIRILV